MRPIRLMMEPIKEQLKTTYQFIKAHWTYFLIFWFVLLALDLTNYFFHVQAGASEENARVVEIIFQLLLVYLSVCFFHGLNLLRLEGRAPFFKVIGEGLLLTPGFVLQSIFFALALVTGAALLVVPGLYVLFVFYFAPVVSVLYPDYKGKIFMLARELTLPHIKAAMLVILFTGILPLIPEGLIWLTTGALKSKATPFIAPLDGALFLFCEAVVFSFIFELVATHRSRSS